MHNSLHTFTYKNSSYHLFQVSLLLLPSCLPSHLPTSLSSIPCTPSPPKPFLPLPVICPNITSCTHTRLLAPPTISPIPWEGLDQVPPISIITWAWAKVMNRQCDWYSYLMMEMEWWWGRLPLPYSLYDSVNYIFAVSHWEVPIYPPQNLRGRHGGASLRSPFALCLCLACACSYVKAVPMCNHHTYSQAKGE